MFWSQFYYLCMLSELACAQETHTLCVFDRLPVVSWRRAKYKQMYGLKSTLTVFRWILKEIKFYLPHLQLESFLISGSDFKPFQPVLVGGRAGEKKWRQGWNHDSCQSLWRKDPRSIVVDFRRFFQSPSFNKPQQPRTRAALIFRTKIAGAAYSLDE